MLVTFFNQGDHLVYQFNPRPERGLNFYWLWDRFFTHTFMNNQDRFLHIFVKDTEKENLTFSFMQGNENWDDVIRHYIWIKKAKAKNIICDDPSILRSNDVLVPDLIFDFQIPGSNEAVVIHPAEHQGIKCRLFTDKHIPIRFDAIPEIVAVLPQIKNSLPFNLNTRRLT